MQFGLFMSRGMSLLNDHEQEKRPLIPKRYSKVCNIAPLFLSLRGEWQARGLPHS